MFEQVKRPPNSKEEAMKQRALETVRTARLTMLDKFPFLGHLSMQLAIVPVLDERLAIAATDGEAVYVNAYAIEHPQKVFKPYFRTGRLKDKFDTAAAILAHEVWHCALLHFDRGSGKDHWKFNIAADIEIGHLLEKAGIQNLSAARCGGAVPGMSAEEIYDLLKLPVQNRIVMAFFKSGFPFLSRKKSNSSNSKEANEPSDNTDDGQTDDAVQDRSDKSDTDEKIKSKFSDGHYSKNRDPDTSDNNVYYGNKGIQDPDFTPATEHSGDESKHFQRKWQDAFRKALSRYSYPGLRPGNMPGNVSKIINSTPQITLNWKQLLLDYVSQTFGGDRQWLPPNRRYVWRDLYLPSRSKQQNIEIVIALDTSGSTTNDLGDFIRELRAMSAAFGTYKMTIIQCDTNIHSVKEYSNDDPLPPEGLRFHGRGGTSLCPPFKYVSEKMAVTPTVMLYFTDGYGPAPVKVPDYPVIWCLTAGGKRPAKWGMDVTISNK